MAEVRTMGGTLLGTADSEKTACIVAASALGLEIEEVKIAGPIDNNYSPDALVTAVICEEISAVRLRESIQKLQAIDDNDNDDALLVLVSPSIQIIELPASFGRIYSNLRSLKIVEQDQLKALPASLGRLKLLETLHVEGTAIHDLPDLSEIVSLRFLYLQRNLLWKLGKLPPVILTLDVRWNHLKEIPDLAKFPYLTQLFVSGNHLIKQLRCSKIHRSLTTLEMEHLSLKEVCLETTTSSLPNLATLCLSVGTPLLFAPACSAAALFLVRAATSDFLRILNLQGCGLASLDYCPLNNLIVLNLKYNELRRLPAMACGRMLENLCVASNKLDSLPSEISAATNLRKLDVSHNLRLHTLPRALSKLSHLESIFVSGCHLERIPPRCEKKVVGWKRF